MSRSPHEFVAGENPTAAYLNGLAKGWLDASTNTSDQTGITGSNVDITGTPVTVTIPAGSTRKIRLTGRAHVTATGTCDWTGTIVTDTGSILGRWGRESAQATGVVTMHEASCLTTAAPGDHTWQMRITLSSGTSVAVAGGSPAGATLLVEDLGASS